MIKFIIIPWNIIYSIVYKRIMTQVVGPESFAYHKMQMNPTFEIAIRSLENIMYTKKQFPTNIYRIYQSLAW